MRTWKDEYTKVFPTASVFLSCRRCGVYKSVMTYCNVVVRLPGQQEMSVEQQTDGGTGEERTYTAPVPRVYRHRYIVNRQLFLIPRQSTDSPPLPLAVPDRSDLSNFLHRKQTSRWEMIANIRTANSDSRGGEMLSPVDNPFSDRHTDKQTSTRLNTYVQIECLLWVGRSSADSRPLLAQISWRHRWNIKLNVSDPRAVIASSPSYECSHTSACLSVATDT